MFHCKCSQTFATSSSLEYHEKLKYHLKKRRQCNFCEIQKRSMYGLSKHIRSKHMKDHKYQKCYFCFRQLERITHMYIAIHKGERYYSCKYCPVGFATTAQYHFHCMKHVGTQEFVKSKSILDKL